MKNTTKIKLATAFKSLIKNEAAVESAKTIPGYVPIIVSVIAVFIPVIPLMVSTSKTYGSQFMKAQTFNLDLYNTDCFLNLKENGYAFAINGGKLKAYKDGVELSNEVESKPLKEYVVSDATKEEIKYQLYYSVRTNSGTDEMRIKKFTDELTNTTYLSGTTYVKGSAESDAEIQSRQAAMEEGKTYKPTFYRPTFVVYYSQGMYTHLNKEGTVTNITRQAGDWNHTEATENLLDRILNVEGFDSILDKDAHGDYKVLRDLEYTAGVQKNMNKLYDETYLTSKQTSFLMYTLIFYGVYLILVVFMGLMIFLLTRGKKNPMNYMSFWLCTKIAMWATISPAVLAMIFGFMISNFATMFFIILYGVRIMWLSMRQLRPAY